MKNRPDITVQHDITYLGPDREEKLDAYLPDPAVHPGPHPAIVLIHGGGWRISHKAAEREINIGTTLAAHGYAVFSIDYLLNIGEKDADGRLHLSRLAWPRNFYDCKTAVRFLRAEAETFNLNPDRIATMGGSAGGHLAMLVGATAHNTEINRHGLYTEQSDDVSCILNFYGDYDIRGRRVSPFAGATPEETAANEVAASPITYIDAHTPPMFITHGTADTIIPVERSRRLAEHLQGLGLDYWYVEISNAPHTFDLEPAEMDLRPVVLSFLHRHLGKPATV